MNRQLLWLIILVASISFVACSPEEYTKEPIILQDYMPASENASNNSTLPDIEIDNSETTGSAVESQELINETVKDDGPQVLVLSHTGFSFKTLTVHGQELLVDNQDIYLPRHNIVVQAYDRNLEFKERYVLFYDESALITFPAKGKYKFSDISSDDEDDLEAFVLELTVE